MSTHDREPGEPLTGSDISAEPESHLPESHWPLPELTAVDRAARVPTAADYSEVAASAEFAQLRTKFRRFAFPMSVAFLLWYFLYVLLSVYARGFMATPVVGNLNIGMIMGLLQFVTTFLLTWLYIRHANKNLDPLAANLRERLEGSEPLVEYAPAATTTTKGTKK